MRDAIIVGALILGLATLVTLHVALVGRLVLAPEKRWRGPVALLVPPLGVVWAFRAGWTKMAVAWLAAVAVYVAALIAAKG